MDQDSLEIEDLIQLAYLDVYGISSERGVRRSVLRGGVSSRTVLVEWTDGIPWVSFAKNRSDRKPCSIRALANDMNRGSREPLAIDLEMWALAPDAFWANHRCGVEPFARFHDVFSHIPACSIIRLSELPPHNWKATTWAAQT
jgi:hypothetical protein